MALHVLLLKETKKTMLARLILAAEGEAVASGCLQELPWGQEALLPESMGPKAGRGISKTSGVSR